MSWQASQAVRDHSQAEGIYKSVLFAMATYADEHGGAIYPAKDNLAKDAGVHRATVYRAVREAEDRGELLTVGKRGKGQIEYSMKPLVDEWKGSPTATRDKELLSPTATPPVAVSDTHRRPQRHQGSPTATQKVIERKEKEPKNSPQPVVDTEKPKTAFQKWQAKQQDSVANNLPGPVA